ncbi:MAG: hypothetical protein JSV62_02790 [Promethearchaeota archaeon]|nr:MAG: hypothetical protein JSV62_02790 [Candidatus Lokiarchaeota archaeon]
MKTNIFVLTEDLNFFYQLNKELKHLQIEFKVLNIGNKIPDIPNSIILSTMKEMYKFKNFDNIEKKILPYAKEDDFEKYIIKLLALIRISKKSYSEIVFSIDPGTKHIGLVVFLDDYYLRSHTFYETDNLIKKIHVYINTFQESITNPLNLIFKFGGGIMPITLKLIEKIFNDFNEERLRVLLIDEARTSKYRIRDDKEKKLPKDEAAALFISLREGIEITQDHFKTFIEQKRINKLKAKEFQVNPRENNEDIDHKLIEIAEDVLKGNLSLSKSIELIKSSKNNN